MAVGDIYRLSVRTEHNTADDDAVNVFHFRQGSGTVFDTPEEDLVGAFIEHCELDYSNCFNPLYTLNLYTVRQVTGGLAVYEQEANVPGNFGTTATCLPSTVAGLISWRTGFAGRSRRGRSYLPPADESGIASGLWTVDYIARLTDFAEAMRDAMSDIAITHAIWNLVVWSSVLNEEFLITQFILPTVPATQRKRRLGSGS